MKKLLLLTLSMLLVLSSSAFAATTTYRLFPIDTDFDEVSGYNEETDFTSITDIVEAAETEGETEIIIQLIENYSLGDPDDDEGEGESITFEENIESLTNITIAGSGHRIIAAGAQRHLVLNAADLTLTLDNVELTGFPGGNSGGIEINAGTLIANNVSFTGLGLEYNAGGAINLGESGSATFMNCTFTGNTATEGGAIYSTGTLTLTGTNRFSGNTANTDGGALYILSGRVSLDGVVFGDGTRSARNVANGNGGAIYVSNEGIVSLGGSYLNTNSADLGGALYVAGSLTLTSANTFTGNMATNGGAIYLAENSSLTITGTDTQTFTSNTATSLGGALYAGQSSSLSWAAPVAFTERNTAARGGAMWIHAGSQVNGITSTVDFTNNIADYGGALYVSINNSSPLPLSSSSGWTFSGNKANYDGGAIYTVAADVVASGLEVQEENSAENAGGFIYAGGEVTVTNSTVSKQRALYAGAIYAGNGATISNSKFESNRAVLNSSTEFIGGGALYVVGELTVSDSSEFTDNRITSAYSKQGGGAIFLSGDGEIAGAKFSDNIYTNNNATQEGGGGSIYVGGRLTLKDCVFTGNEAKGPTGGGQGQGGAIFASSSTVTISNCYFEDNRADFNGGAVYVADNSTTTLRYTTFSHNSTVNGNGGAIYAQGILDMGTYDDRHNMSSNVGANYFVDNSSARNGGAICFNYRLNGQGQLRVSYTMFMNNSTINGQGGAMYIYNDSAAIESCTFSGNSCTSGNDSLGGAVYMGTSETSQSTIINSTFSENKAYGSSVSYGGALYTSGTITLISNTFTNGNEAGSRGGAIYVGNGSLTMTANIVVGNISQVGNDICNEAQITTNGYNRVGIYGTGNASSAQNALWSLAFNNETDRESDKWTTDTFFGLNAELAINATGNENEPPFIGCSGLIDNAEEVWLLTIKLSEDINLPMLDRATNVIPYARRLALNIPRYDEQRVDRFASGSAITIGASYAYRDWNDDSSGLGGLYPIETITMSGIPNLKYPGQATSLIAMIRYTNGRTAYGVAYDKTNYVRNAEEPVRWESSIPTAVQIDKNGNVTALSGTGPNGAVITVTTVRLKTTGQYASASRSIIVNYDDYSDTYNYLNLSTEYQTYLYGYLEDLYRFDYDLSFYLADVNSSAVTASSFQNSFSSTWNTRASQVTDLTTSGPMFNTETIYSGSDGLTASKKGAVNINFQNRTAGDVFPVVYSWNFSGEEVTSILGSDMSSSQAINGTFVDRLFSKLRIVYRGTNVTWAVIGGSGVKASEALSSGALVIRKADGNRGLHVELTAYLANVSTSGNNSGAQLVKSSGSNKLLVVPDGADDGAITGSMWMLQTSTATSDTNTNTNTNTDQQSSSGNGSGGGGGCDALGLGFLLSLSAVIILLKRK